MVAVICVLMCRCDCVVAATWFFWGGATVWSLPLVFFWSDLTVWLLPFVFFWGGVAGTSLIAHAHLMCLLTCAFLCVQDLMVHMGHQALMVPLG